MKDQHCGDKPESVIRAVKLLWFAVGLGLIKVFLDFASWKTEGYLFFTFLGIVVMLILYAILITKISHGKNWARVLFLVLFSIGLLPAVPELFKELASSPLLGVVSCLQIIIHCYAMFLLFSKPGSSWYLRS